jgi:hypothetical protein
LIDPYFDQDGLEFLLRVEETHHVIEILTNTQVRSFDSSGKEVIRVHGKEPQRASNIILFCKKYEPILGRLNLRILDLRSKNGGNSQLFHDRLLMVYDIQNSPIKGFHLSNSLQGATKRNPLLITPIPMDVLPDVCDYVSMLLEVRGIISEAESVVLYDSIKVSQNSHPLPQVDERPFLAILLKNDEILLCPPDSLGKMLMPSGLIDSGGHYCYNDKISGSLSSLFKDLSRNDFDKFVPIWEAIGSCLAKSVDDSLYEKISVEAFQFVKHHLKAYLLSFFTTSYDVPKAIAGYAYLFNNKDFLSSLGDAEYCMSRFSPMYGLPWGLNYAIAIYIDNDPGELIGFWDDELVRQITTEMDSFSLPLLRLTTIGLKIFELISEKAMGATECIRHLLVSRTPVFRAAAAQFLSPSNCPLRGASWKAKSMLELIKHLSDPVERLFSVAEWVGDLRVIANRASREEDNVRDTRHELFEWMISNWVPTITSDQLRLLVKRVSGPIEGSWAMSTTNDLLIPLVKSKQLVREIVDDLWVNIFLEEISKGLEGKTQFFYSAHADLTRTVAFLMPHSEESSWGKCHTGISNILKDAERFYWRPLSRSINYSQWAESVQTIVWAYSFFECLLLEINRQHHDSPRLDFVCDCRTKIEPIVSEIKIDELHVKHLVQFYQEVHKFSKKN